MHDAVKEWNIHPTTLACHLTVRGQPNTLHSQSTDLDKLLSRKQHPSLLTPYTVKLSMEKDSGWCIARNEGATIVSYIEQLLERGQRLAASGAYLHWFERYDQDFKLLLEESIETVQNISDAYTFTTT